MKYASKRKRGSWQRSVLIVLCTVLALVLAVMVAATVYIEMLFGQMNRLSGDGPQSTLSLEDSVPGDDVQPGDEGELDLSGAVEAIVSDDIVNILLVGQDRRENEERQRSDAMILCTINTKTKTLTMTSFLRDMWVRIPGYYDERINVPYLLGGFETLNDTLEYNFGIRADGNVEVDFNGFIQVIDMVGGVAIELTAEEANHLNAQADWSLTEGLNLLDGEQALAYSRIRKLDSDWGRTSRQRTVLTALLKSVKGMNLLEMNDLLMNALPMITTDMSNSEIIGYALRLFPILSDLKVVTQQVPADGTWYYDDVDGKSVIQVDEAANRDFLHETLLGE